MTGRRPPRRRRGATSPGLVRTSPGLVETSPVLFRRAAARRRRVFWQYMSKTASF